MCHGPLLLCSRRTPGCSAWSSTPTRTCPSTRRTSSRCTAARNATRCLRTSTPSQSPRTAACCKVSVCVCLSLSLPPSPFASRSLSPLFYFVPLLSPHRKRSWFCAALLSPGTCSWEWLCLHISVSWWCGYSRWCVWEGGGVWLFVVDVAGAWGCSVCVLCFVC